MLWLFILIGMIACLGLNQFSQNVAINAKGGDCWQYDQSIRSGKLYDFHLWQHICFADKS